MRVPHRIYLAAASAVVLATLSGCSVYRSVTNYINSDKPILCPDAAILASTADLPAFDPNVTPDPSTVLYTVHLTNVTTSCDIDKRAHTADTSLRIFWRATRPSGGGDASYRVPYYVAVTTRGNVEAKQMHWLDIRFDRGQTTLTGSHPIEDVTVTPAKGHAVDEYRMVVGFQLTEAQLEYNKKIGRFLQ